MSYPSTTRRGLSHRAPSGGSANGQFTSLLIVPERNFSVVAVSNAGPDGGLAVNHATVRCVLEHYLGVIDRNRRALLYDEMRAREIVGKYENGMMTFTIGSDGAGLTVECGIKPEIRVAGLRTQNCPRISRRLASACCPATRTTTSSRAAV
jgi:hypothetical protein